MKLSGRAELGQWKKATTEYERIMAKAATLGMRQIGKLAETAGRQAITAGGFSGSFARTLRAINKPPSGYVLNPAVYIHSTINYADIFETGKTITGNKYLWLPLPRVPPIKGRPHMTPRQYIQRVGPLVLMWRPGGMPMLGAVVETGGKPTRGRLRRTFLKQRFGEKIKHTVTTIPMFVAVESVNIPKKFDTEEAIKNAMDKLEDSYHEIIRPDESQISGD